MLLLEYGWIFLCFGAALHAVGWYRRGSGELDATGGSRRTLVRLCVAAALLGMIPFIVMGVGVTRYQLTMVHYFDPLSSRIPVQAFFVSVYVLWLLGTVWVFAGRGAETLSTHPGAFPFAVPIANKEKGQKILWVLIVVSGLLGIGISVALRPMTLKMIDAISRTYAENKLG